MLAEGLALLQGVQQLQTAQVGQQANGYGSKSKWSLQRPGTTVYVNAATGLRPSAIPASNPQALAALGSAVLPFASLEDALAALAEPASVEAFEAPRMIVIGPGEYETGGVPIARSLTLLCDPATRITDAVVVQSKVYTGSTTPIAVNVLCPAGATTFVPVLGDGITVERDGTSTRQVFVGLDGVDAGVVAVEAAVPGALVARNSRFQLAVDGASSFDCDARNCVVAGPAFRARSVYAAQCSWLATTVTCDGTSICRLYGTSIPATVAWTGGTLQIDTSTDFDWTATTSTKANPGGAAAVIMT